VAKILIVDDSDNIRMTLKLTLGFKGHEVVEAENGQEAIAELQRGKFDMVFCDLAMPGMGGQEVIRKAREEMGLKDLPIVVLSAEAREFKNKALTVGATDFIDKPFAPEQIFDAVARWLKT
jgi:CheY-like chemotaxis protein